MQENIFEIGTSLNMAGFEAGRVQLIAKLKALETQIKTSGGAGGTGFANLGPQVKAAGDAAKLLNKDITSFTTNTEGGLAKVNLGMTKFNQQSLFAAANLAVVAKRVLLWSTAAAAIFGAITKIREAVTFTMDLEDQMIELKKVLPKGSDLDFFKGKTFKLAELYGIDPIEVAKNFKIFAQAGLNANEVIEATNAALLAVNTTGATTEEAFNGLIAAVKTFNLEWNDAAGVVDKVMRLQADYVVESRDLIVAIQKVGPAVRAVGGNLDDLLAMITAIAQVSRVSGAEAANALKIMFSRLATPETAAALQKQGILVRKSVTEFRPLRNILSDVADVWAKAGTAQKMTIGIALAQSRQFPRIAALLDAWNVEVEAARKSQMAWGDALEANAIQMEASRKKISSAAASMKEFGESLMKYGLVGLLVTMTGVFGKLSSVLAGMPSLLSGSLINFVALFAALSIGVKVVAALAVGLRAARIALMGISIPGAVVFGVISAIAAVAIAYSTANRKTSVSVEELSEKIDYLGKKLRPLKDLTIQGLVSTDIMGKTTKLVSIVNSLGKSYGDTGSQLKNIEKAFKDAGVEVGNLSGNFADQQKLLEVLSVVYNIMAYDSVKASENAFTRAQQKIKEFSEEILKSTQTSLKFEKVQLGMREAIGYGVRIGAVGIKFTGSEAVARLVSELENLGVSFSDLKERASGGEKVILTLGDIIDRVLKQKNIETFAKAWTIASGAVNEFGSGVPDLDKALFDLMTKIPDYGEKMAVLKEEINKILESLKEGMLPANVKKLKTNLDALRVTLETYREKGIKMTLAIDDPAYRRLMSNFTDIDVALKNQMKDIDRVAIIYKGLGLAYDVDAQKLKALEGTERDYMSALDSLRKGIRDLTEEYVDKQKQLAIGIDLEDEEKDKLQRRIDVLELAIQKLETYRKELEEGGEAAKKQAEIIGDETPFRKAIAYYDRLIKSSEYLSSKLQTVSDYTTEYYRILGKEPSKILGVQLAYLDKLKQKDLERLNIEIERGDKAEINRADLELEISRKYELQEIELKNAVALENVRKLYGGIVDDTQSIRSSLSDWLTDTDAFIENLQQTKSGLRVIGRLLEPLGKIFLQRQAEILVKMIIPDDAGKITHTWIKSAHEIGGQIVYDDIIRAFSAVQISAPGAGVGVMAGRMGVRGGFGYVPPTAGAPAGGFGVPGGFGYASAEDLKSMAALKGQTSKAKKEAAMALAGQFAGAMAGAGIAKAGGKGTEWVGTMTTIGGMLGMINPVLGVVGGVLGGIIGGTMGDKLEDISQSTAEVAENTSELVERLSPAMFNVPSTFVMPRGISYGGGVNGNVIFNIQSNNPQGVGKEVERVMNERFGYSQRRTGFKSKTIGV